ncbi:MAG: aryl-sulfate sulfotransferase, partial [Ignavibacteriaceae bacterium]|nr:aryl-sulfate sulfotransferase [Ignavibacteriaceae bacterium]
IILIIISISISAQVPIDPNFPTFQITVNNNPTAGQLLFSPFYNSSGPSNPPFLAIMNNDGTFKYIKLLAQSAFDFNIQPNGNYTYFDLNTGYFYEMDSSFNLIDSFFAQNGYITDQHELRILLNGNALILGLDHQKIDMSKVVQGGNPYADVTGCILQELDKYKNVLFQWRSWDHYNITDAMPDINLLDSSIDYVHANAIEIDNDGNYLLSCRHMDEITKINHITGDIIWRLGGKNNQFRFINDTIGFSHQHYIRRIANGDITLFDNGNLHIPQFSRAVEYKLDEKNKTATLVWEYKNDPVTFTFAMGSVQRLDNGNTLIGWGANITNNKQISEVTSSGEKVFELEIPYNWSYRAYRYNIQSTISNNNSLAINNFTMLQNFPNPFNPNTTIDYSIPVESNVSLVVYNSIGEKIQDLILGIKPAGNYSVNFKSDKVSSGIYFYSLTANSIDGKQNFHSVKKMIVLK